MASEAVIGSVQQSGLSSQDAARQLALEGPNEVPEQRVNPFLRFAGKFWGLSAWMLELIAVLSFILHKPADLAVALSLLLVNALLSFLQEQRASGALATLRRRLQVTARVLRDGAWGSLSARELVRGDIVRVRTGDIVPADLRLLDGSLRIDQSALTGESQDVGRAAGHSLYAGSVVRHGEANALVTATGTRTYFGRTAHLVDIARPKLHVEEVIARVVRWLLIIVGAQVAVAATVALAGESRLVDILPLALVLLMGAIPVALPVMFTVSMAVGSMELARRGILVTRLSAVEDAANMNVLCADKTGTLTMNRLSVRGVRPQPGFTEADVLTAAALASNEADQDPIDLAFLNASRERDLLDQPAKVLSFVPFSPETRRTEALVEVGGRRLRVIKGALRAVAQIAGVTDAELRTLESSAHSEADQGIRLLAVARAQDDAPLRLAGVALLHDPPRPDSRQLLDRLRSLGIAVKMLTGDALPVARGIAREMGIGQVVRAPDLRAEQTRSPARIAELVGAAGGFAEVFPEDKYLVVKSLQEAGHIVGMTGDGVNDAPALRQAEVGIAVSGAADVARQAASVVLTIEGLAGIVELVANGRAIYQRVLTWIINKVSRTILKTGFVVVAFLATGKFVISALGMVLLVFMTDFVKISLATDHVRPSPKPETWNIAPLIKVAAVLGLLMLVEALIALATGWRWMGADVDPGQLQTLSFQILLFFALFSILSIRERRAFWASMPSRLLLWALAGDTAIGLLIGLHGMGELKPLPLEVTGGVVAYALGCSLVVNDFAKLALLTVFVKQPLGKDAVPPASHEPTGPS